MTSPRVDFSSMESMLAFIRRFPDAAVFNAARAAKWQFSRGRPSVEVLLHTWVSKYPHWVNYVAKALDREYPSGPPAFAKTSIPPGFEDDDVPFDTNHHDDRIPPKAADLPPNVPHPAPNPVDLTEYVKREEMRTAMGVTTRAIVQGIEDAFNPRLSAQEREITALREEIADLRKRAPIEIVIDNVKLPPIEGQHEKFPELVKWCKIWRSTKLHPLLIGEAGTGKTTAALNVAKLFGLDIYLQPQSMDAFAVFGYTTPDGRIIDSEFSRAWKHGGVCLWDEQSLSSPDALGALNAALANGLAPLPGVGTVAPHADFYFIGGDNSDTGATLKYSARNLMDGASLDRFVRIEWGIDPVMESRLSNGESDWLECVRAVRAFINQREIQHVGATPRAVIAGAAALASKAFTRKEILEATLRKGVLIDTWGDILKLEPVREFLAGV